MGYYRAMILDSNILIGILALCVLALTADQFHLRWKLRKMLCAGKKGKAIDFGETLIAVNKDVKDLEKFRTDMEGYLKNVEKRLRRSTQANEMVRFNAFRGDGLGGATGGNQSFATAFLNEEGDGTILSSIYARERVSVFAKPIAKFNAEGATLTEEEQRAVHLAKVKLSDRS